MSFLDVEQLIVALAGELKSRRMNDEVAFLRRLFGQRRRQPGAWDTDDMRMVELACMVGVPPFESVFLQQPRHYRCPCTGADRHRGRTEARVFPASSAGPPLTAHWCRRCGTQWVVVGDL